MLLKAQEIPPAPSSDYAEAILDRINSINDLCDSLDEIVNISKGEKRTDNRDEDMLTLATEVSKGVTQVIDNALQRYDMPVAAAKTTLTLLRRD